MSKLLVVVLSGLFAANLAFAQAPAMPSKPASAMPDAVGKPAVPAATPMAATKAPAASDCEAKAVGKSGKPLAGAAKTAFLKKCEGEAKGTGDVGSGCEAKAVSKAGKPLAGAARDAFVKKCEADAMGGK